MKIAILITRSILGLIFLVFGLNFFFHFLTMPPSTGKAAAFTGGLFGAGYFFPYMKVIEIACAIFLLINRYTSFFLLILFPVTLNIFLYDAFLAPDGLALGGLMLLIHLFLGFAYGKYYKSLFTPNPVL